MLVLCMTIMWPRYDLSMTLIFLMKYTTFGRYYLNNWCFCIKFIWYINVEPFVLDVQEIYDPSDVNVVWLSGLICLIACRHKTQGFNASAHLCICPCKVVSVIHMKLKITYAPNFQGWRERSKIQVLIGLNMNKNAFVPSVIRMHIALTFGSKKY